MAEHADCMAIGPGLGTHHETTALVRRVLCETTVPAVVDADGLNALAEAADIAAMTLTRQGPLVLTPHLGEFVRLAGLPRDTASLLESLDPEGGDGTPPLAVHALNLAEKLGVTVVLKGAPTLVATAGGRLFANPTGNAGMATAGSGDVLTGLISGLIAQSMPPEQAAVAGVFLHGLAGDLAKEGIGEWGMKAGDVCRHLPQAMVETAGQGHAKT